MLSRPIDRQQGRRPVASGMAAARRVHRATAACFPVDFGRIHPNPPDRPNRPSIRALCRPNTRIAILKRSLIYLRAAENRELKEVVAEFCRVRSSWSGVMRKGKRPTIPRRTQNDDGRHSSKRSKSMPISNSSSPPSRAPEFLRPVPGVTRMHAGRVPSLPRIKPPGNLGCEFYNQFKSRLPGRGLFCRAQDKRDDREVAPSNSLSRSRNVSSR